MPQYIISIFLLSGKYFGTLYPVSFFLLRLNFLFKSIDIKTESFISDIAFKIKTEEPPSATPISKQFFGLCLLNIPLIK